MKCKRCDGTGDEPVQKEIGRRFKVLRKAGRLGLREMAGYMGISHGYLSQLEGGTRTWSRSLTQRFSRQLTKHTNKL